MLHLLAFAASAQQGAPKPVTVGFGLGLVAPGSLLAPNVTSARIRLTEGFTLSPTAGYTYSTTVDGTGDPYEDTVTRDVDLAVGAEVLGVVARRGSAVLQLVGGAEFGADTITVEPDEPSEIRTEARGFGVYYGLGVEWFLGATEPHVSLSAHALNPVASFAGTRVFVEGSNSETTSSTTTIGVVWEPSVRFMVHLYL